MIARIWIMLKEALNEEENTIDTLFARDYPYRMPPTRLHLKSGCRRRKIDG